MATRAPRRLLQVLYHCPCPDGAFAGLAAFLRFKDCPDVDLKFIPHATFKELDFNQQGFSKESSEVFLLDYVGPGEKFLTRLSESVKQVTLIDHHKTAFELVDALRQRNALASNVDVHLEMQRSGATLAYHHFAAEQTLVQDPKRRELLEKVYAYIEDNDLWRKALPGTKEFSAGLAARRIEFDYSKNPDVFSQLLSLDADTLIEEGRRCIAEDQATITADLARSFTVKLGGADADFGRCLAVLTTNPQLRSDMGHQLAVKSQQAGLRGIGVVAYTEADMTDKTKIKLSLRSVADEDTTVISKHYGGGGHLNASSFALDAGVFAKEWRL